MLENISHNDWLKNLMISGMFWEVEWKYIYQKKIVAGVQS